MFHQGATEFRMDNTCEWIGDGEGCRQPSMFRKAYCEDHHNRIYLKLLPEMADYIVEKEIEVTLKNAD